MLMYEKYLARNAMNILSEEENTSKVDERKLEKNDTGATTSRQCGKDKPSLKLMNSVFTRKKLASDSFGFRVENSSSRLFDTER